MKLRNELLGPLSEALLDAFPTISSFDQMLLFKLGINRQTISNGGLSEIVLQTIITFESNDETSKLLLKARESNNRNVKLQEVARLADLATQTFVEKAAATQNFIPATDERVLERTIKKANPQIDVMAWRTKLGEIEGRVCRIEYNSGGNTVTGTGFLVAPDVVLTNYHVMEDIIKGKVSPRDVSLRFDHKKLSDGTTINSGTIVKLSSTDDWNIDFSPYSEVDTLIDPQDREPAADELDYALLLLEKEIGKLPLGTAAAVGDPLRGYIRLSDQTYDFPADTALFILQHPDDAPLKLVLDTESVIGVNSNQTRVRYRTNTEHGSSGSPCFNVNWELIALHHSGDPNYAPLHRPTYNQGIPVKAIHALVKSKGKDSYFGK